MEGEIAYAYKIQPLPQTILAPPKQYKEGSPPTPPTRIERIKVWIQDFSLKREVKQLVKDAILAADFTQLPRPWWLCLLCCFIVFTLMLIILVMKDISVRSVFFGPSGARYAAVGGLNGTAVLHQCEVWRVLTYIPAHAGLVHLAGNMYSMICLAIILSKKIHFWTMLLVMICSAANGGILKSAFGGHGASVGASAAVMGLVGCTFSAIATDWHTLASKYKALKSPCLSVALQLVYCAAIPVNQFLLGVGAIYWGTTIGLLFMNYPGFRRRPEGYTQYKFRLWLLGLVMLLVGLLYDGSVLYNFRCFGGRPNVGETEMKFATTGCRFKS